MAFTEDERSRILHVLGYPKQNALENSFATGYAISQSATLQYLFDAFRRISAEGEARVREDLAQIQCIDRQLVELRGQAGVTNAGDVTLDPSAGRKHLKRDRLDYVNRLCDDLGVPVNPASRQFGPQVRNT